jgi:hypothetical protein
LASTANNGLVRWTYGDWRRQPTVADQIDRLIRHIEEVERYAFESQDKGRRLTMHQNMLSRLETQLEKLQARQKIGNSSALRRTGQTSKFNRGSDS